MTSGSRALSFLRSKHLVKGLTSQVRKIESLTRGLLHQFLIKDKN